MHGLKELQSLCKASIHLDINDHKSCYDSVVDYLKECDQKDQNSEIEPEILQKMIDSDTVIELQFYPRTPIGFFKIYHYDVDLAIDQAVKIILNEPTN